MPLWTGMFTRGRIYCYRLVDVRLLRHPDRPRPDLCSTGMATAWPMTGRLPAVWIATVDDADLDADNDGLTDTGGTVSAAAIRTTRTATGNGIRRRATSACDMAPADPGGSLSLSPRGARIWPLIETGVHPGASHPQLLRRATTSRLTIEQFEKLSVGEYVHGCRAEVGKPQLPLKGIMLDISRRPIRTI